MASATDLVGILQPEKVTEDRVVFARERGALFSKLLEGHGGSEQPLVYELVMLMLTAAKAGLYLLILDLRQQLRLVAKWVVMEQTEPTKLPRLLPSGSHWRHVLWEAVHWQSLDYANWRGPRQALMTGIRKVVSGPGGVLACDAAFKNFTQQMDGAKLPRVPGLTEAPPPAIPVVVA
ncbi:hypothetical protein WJX74_006084 [Apatococcus lobatus]|uniref:Uncharacterized protein n=2 Tax=Apatococcus TaxID=904362 RepID=A0AAW1T2V3_9CHLO